jgi:glycosyltransferase involved in cell wall biosynthesis
MDSREARSRLGLDQSGIYVLFAADPSRVEKNFALAEAAVAELVEENVNLLCVHGETHERMRLFFNAVNATLMTSWHEGSPNVIKEALACNCPIVSTAVGDVPELLAGVSGCTIATFDAAAVADGLRVAVRHGRILPGDALLSRDIRATSAAFDAVYQSVARLS